MVVGVEPGLLQASGLVAGEHAQGAAGLQAELLDAADHLQDAVERRAVADLAPGGAHAEPGRAVVAGPAGGGQHVADVHQGLGGDVGVVPRGLGAVAAVLGAAAGLDRQEHADLHLARVVVAAVDLGGAEDQVEDRGAVDLGHRRAGPGRCPGGGRVRRGRLVGRGHRAWVPVGGWGQRRADLPMANRARPARQAVAR